eukprot:CAMPEP_0202815396 /NCGR_PEP_ID=MMETSP1389-20130828/6193_1 /ASSEMBLY_ACC=CAM_ASM_000865 /TAXON_ID=302021 /ORGANISM="Rhodomonas sp., Strain CCMP768" /LENGTH=80 /DNA_ID=CAMNT_0049487291 /DNA_START=43 /DNA_END=285 /DNA_ORIENTATION=-
MVGGAAYGAAVHWMSNGLQKLPWTRKPWELALLIGIGAFAGKFVCKEEARQTQIFQENMQKLKDGGKNVLYPLPFGKASE